MESSVVLLFLGRLLFSVHSRRDIMKLITVQAMLGWCWDSINSERSSECVFARPESNVRFAVSIGRRSIEEIWCLCVH